MLMRIASGLMTVFFGVLALLQYNDPDPVFWVGLYGLVALCSALYVAGWRSVVFTNGVAVVCLLVAVYLTGRVLIYEGVIDQTGQEMMGLTEVARELLGLLIAVGWTGILALWEGSRGETPSSAQSW